MKAQAVLAVNENLWENAILANLTKIPFWD